MGIKEYKKRPMEQLDKDVLRYVGMNPGTWRLYTHFKNRTDREVDQTLSKLQQFGYLKVVGTAEGRSTWHLTDLGRKAFLSLTVNINSIEWDKQDDGAYRVTTPLSSEPVGYVKKMGGSWAFVVPSQYPKNRWLGTYKTRNEATEELINAAYSVE